MPKIFIAGHGRVIANNGQAQRVPMGVTIRWSVPLYYNSTVGLSRAILRGDYTNWSETKAEGELYLEHYLCPDLAMIMCTKGQAFAEGNWLPTRTHLLQPRLKFVTKLSDIVSFLKREFSEPLEIYWTCCRSPEKQVSRGAIEYNAGVISVTPPNGNTVAEIGSEPGVKIINDKIDRGSVTMMRKDSPGLNLAASWPDAHVAASSQVSKQKNLIANMF